MAESTMARGEVFGGGEDCFRVIRRGGSVSRFVVAPRGDGGGGGGARGGVSPSTARRRFGSDTGRGVVVKDETRRERDTSKRDHVTRTTAAREHGDQDRRPELLATVISTAAVTTSPVDASVDYASLPTATVTRRQNDHHHRRHRHRRHHHRHRDRDPHSPSHLGSSPTHPPQPSTAASSSPAATAVWTTPSSSAPSSFTSSRRHVAAIEEPTTTVSPSYLPSPSGKSSTSTTNKSPGRTKSQQRLRRHLNDKAHGHNYRHPTPEHEDEQERRVLRKQRQQLQQQEEHLHYYHQQHQHQQQHDAARLNQPFPLRGQQRISSSSASAPYAASSSSSPSSFAAAGGGGLIGYGVMDINITAPSATPMEARRRERDLIVSPSSTSAGNSSTTRSRRRIYTPPSITSSPREESALMKEEGYDFLHGPRVSRNNGGNSGGNITTNKDGSVVKRDQTQKIHKQQQQQQQQQQRPQLKSLLQQQQLLQELSQKHLQQQQQEQEQQSLLEPPSSSLSPQRSPTSPPQPPPSIPAPTIKSTTTSSPTEKTTTTTTAAAAMATTTTTTKTIKHKMGGKSLSSFFPTPPPPPFLSATATCTTASSHSVSLYSSSYSSRGSSKTNNDNHDNDHDDNNNDNDNKSDNSDGDDDDVDYTGSNNNSSSDNNDNDNHNRPRAKSDSNLVIITLPIAKTPKTAAMAAASRFIPCQHGNAKGRGQRGGRSYNGGTTRNTDGEELDCTNNHCHRHYCEGEGIATTTRRRRRRTTTTTTGANHHHYEEEGEEEEECLFVKFDLSNLCLIRTNTECDSATTSTNKNMEKNNKKKVDGNEINNAADADGGAGNVKNKDWKSGMEKNVPSLYPKISLEDHDDYDDDNDDNDNDDDLPPLLSLSSSSSSLLGAKAAQEKEKKEQNVAVSVARMPSSHDGHVVDDVDDDNDEEEEEEQELEGEKLNLTVEKKWKYSDDDTVKEEKEEEENHTAAKKEQEEEEEEEEKLGSKNHAVMKTGGDYNVDNTSLDDEGEEEEDCSARASHNHFGSDNDVRVMDNDVPEIIVDSDDDDDEDEDEDEDEDNEEKEEQEKHTEESNNGNDVSDDHDDDSAAEDEDIDDAMNMLSLSSSDVDPMTMLSLGSGSDDDDHDDHDRPLDNDIVTLDDVDPIKNMLSFTSLPPLSEKEEEEEEDDSDDDKNEVEVEEELIGKDVSLESEEHVRYHSSSSSNLGKVHDVSTCNNNKDNMSEKNDSPDGSDDAQLNDLFQQLEKLERRSNKLLMNKAKKDEFDHDEKQEIKEEDALKTPPSTPPTATKLSSFSGNNDLSPQRAILSSASSTAAHNDHDDDASELNDLFSQLEKLERRASKNFLMHREKKHEGQKEGEGGEKALATQKLVHKTDTDVTLPHPNHSTLKNKKPDGGPETFVASSDHSKRDDVRLDDFFLKLDKLEEEVYLRRRRDSLVTHDSSIDGDDKNKKQEEVEGHVGRGEKHNDEINKGSLPVDVIREIEGKKKLKPVLFPASQEGREEPQAKADKKSSHFKEGKAIGRMAVSNFAQDDGETTKGVEEEDNASAPATTKTATSRFPDEAFRKQPETRDGPLFDDANTGSDVGTTNDHLSKASILMQDDEQVIDANMLLQDGGGFDPSRMSSPAASSGSSDRTSQDELRLLERLLKEQDQRKSLKQQKEEQDELRLLEQLIEEQDRKKAEKQRKERQDEVRLLERLLAEQEQQRAEKEKQEREDEILIMQLEEQERKDFKRRQKENQKQHNNVEDINHSPPPGYAEVSAYEHLREDAPTRTMADYEDPQEASSTLDDTRQNIISHPRRSTPISSSCREEVLHSSEHEHFHRQDDHHSRCPRHHSAPAGGDMGRHCAPPHESGGSNNGDNERFQVEISPGQFMPLRGSYETWDAVLKGRAQMVQCVLCRLNLKCVRDAEFVLCPDCRVLSPITQKENTDDAGIGTGGVGLGVKLEDMLRHHHRHHGN